MTVVAPALENFVSIHREEETIRAKSLEELHKAELIHHGVVLETAMSALHHFTIAWATDDRDKLIIQLLGRPRQAQMTLMGLTAFQRPSEASSSYGKVISVGPDNDD